MLALEGPYQPRVDAAGFGKTVAISRERLRANCDYLMTFVRDESVEIQLSNGSVFPCQGAGTWFLPPGVEHTIRLAGGGRLYWVHFSVYWSEKWWSFEHEADFKLTKPGRRAHIQPGPREVWGIDVPYWLPESTNRLAEVAIPDIVDAFLAGEPLDRYRAHALLGSFLNRMIDGLIEGHMPRSKISSTGDDGRIRLAERLVRRHMGREVSVDDMAKEAGWSRTYFSSVYKRVRHESPGSYIRRIRLDEAATLLRTQSGEIADVGSVVGYPDPSAFGRAFRRQFGMSPGAYREQQSDNNLHDE